MKSETRIYNLLLIQVSLLGILVACTHTPISTAVPSTLPPTKQSTPLNITPQSENDMQSLIQPENLIYVGAFRLPGEYDRPKTFAYGGNAMTYNPDGDQSSTNDGFPGTLFITGHDRLAYGELTDGSQVAEITIPKPQIAEDIVDLPYAQFSQEFQNVAKGFFNDLDEIPRIGLTYLNTPVLGPQLHIAWGQHMPSEPAVPSHAVFDTVLDKPDMKGPWFIGSQSTQSTTGYLFTVPSDWADTHLGGKLLATGRFRDGGWSGMGPSLFVYKPWVNLQDGLVAAGEKLQETVLLLYRNSLLTDSIEDAMHNYQHPDEWEGGEWLTEQNGSTAVIFSGTKGTGEKYWYGYINPINTEKPCVDQDMVGQFIVCRFADGSPCPNNDLIECVGHNDYRGWWSSRFDAQLLFYSPYDLLQVARGEISSWEPQPYAVQDIDEVLYLNPSQIETDMLGTGDQRRMRVGPLAYDYQNQVLYLLEYFADGAKPIIHVWRIESL